jgi:hypothetical protein
MHVFIPGDMALIRNNEVAHYVPQTSAVWQVTSLSIRLGTGFSWLVIVLVLMNATVLIGFEFIISVNVKGSYFWVLTPCSRVDVYRHFGSNIRVCGLVVRVSGYRSRGSGFYSRPYQIFWNGVHSAS